MSIICSQETKPAGAGLARSIFRAERMQRDILGRADNPHWTEPKGVDLGQQDYVAGIIGSLGWQDRQPRGMTECRSLVDWSRCTSNSRSKPVAAASLQIHKLADKKVHFIRVPDCCCALWAEPSFRREGIPSRCMR